MRSTNLIEMSVHKVSSLPVDPGLAGWNSILPKADPVASLQTDLVADWLIIGAGFAGLAAARRLSQLDPAGRVVVLEASRVAQGPAGRNSGFMIDLPHDLTSEDYGGALQADRLRTADNRHAIKFAQDMAGEFGLDKEAIDLSGKMNAAATEKGHQHNLDYAAHLKNMGEPFELFTAAKMQEITGTKYYQSGLFTPGTAIIQPAKFVRGVAHGLRTKGVSIYENSPVTCLERKGDWIAQTPNGNVRAPKVILAVNGHLNSFGFAKNRLMHVFTYASMTRALSCEEIGNLGGQPVWGATPADPMGTTVRRISGTGGARIIIRNRFTYDPGMTVPDRRIPNIARDHDKAFAARFPMLSDVEMEYRWGGRLCLSRNNVQLITELEPNLFSACCQNGLGTTKGTLAGMLAAELATGTKSAELDRAIVAEIPQKIPVPGISCYVAKAVLKFKEFRAGREL